MLVLILISTRMRISYIQDMTETLGQQCHIWEIWFPIRVLLLWQHSSPSCWLKHRCGNPSYCSCCQIWNLLKTICLWLERTQRGCQTHQMYYGLKSISMDFNGLCQNRMRWSHSLHIVHCDRDQIFLRRVPPHFLFTLLETIVGDVQTAELQQVRSG